MKPGVGVSSESSSIPTSRFPPVSVRSYSFLFLFGLVLRLGFLAWNWHTAPDWNIDALGYHHLAVNLLARRGFSLNTAPPFQPDGIRTPGYPLFLVLVYALTNVTPRAVLILQALLDAITAVVVADMTWRLARARGVALLAGFLYALLPLAWRYAAELYVESFLAFWLTFTFWLTLWVVQTTERRRMSGALALGVVTGFSLLVKPNVLLLPLFVAGILLAHRLFRHMLVFTAACMFVLTPWVARNVLVFGHPTLSLAFMNNLARVSAPATLAWAQHETIAPWTPRWEALFSQVVNVAAREYPALFATPEADLSPRQVYQRQAALADAAQAIIRAHPRAFLISHLAGALRGWQPLEQRFWYARLTGVGWEATFPDGFIYHLMTKGWQQTPVLASTLFFFFLTWRLIQLVGAGLGAIRLYPRDRAFVLALVLFIFYVTTLPGPIAYDRFHMPIMPLLHVFSAAGLVGLWRMARSIRQRMSTAK